MSELTIITNNVPRDIVDAWELTAAERAEFDYIDWDAVERGEDSASLVRYRGELVDLGDGFERIPAGTALAESGFELYQPDSFFSGLVLRYRGDDFKRVIVGRYYS